MRDVDVGSAIAGGTEDDQRKQGTHKEHFSRLSEQFHELVENGAATPDRYKQLCITLLKSFEAIRLEQETSIKNYEAKIAYCRATQQSCSLFSNLLVGIISSQVQEVKRAVQLGHEPPNPAVPSNGGRISDTEMLQRICICGCVDDEDASNCDCSCHKGEPCGQTGCVVCKALAVQMGSEVAERRRVQPPKKQKTSKKRRKPEKDKE